MARLALLPVCIEGAIEVSALAVHVHVQGIEARTALRERIGHDLAHVAQKLRELGATDSPRRSASMKSGAPERLIGIDVADPGHQGLIEQRSLDLGVLHSHSRNEGVIIERGVERVARDVHDLGWNPALDIIGHEFGRHESAEGALIDKAKFTPIVIESDPHSQVTLVSGVTRLHQQLTTHPEMRDQRRAVIERKPEVLPAPTDTADRSALKCGPERAHLTAYSTRIEHIHIAHGATTHMLGKATSHDLDLGQLGHQRPAISRTVA